MHEFIFYIFNPNYFCYNWYAVFKVLRIPKIDPAIYGVLSIVNLMPGNYFVIVFLNLIRFLAVSSN